MDSWVFRVGHALCHFTMWYSSLCGGESKGYSRVLQAKDNSVSWSQERIISCCKMNEQTPLKQACVLCSEVVSYMWVVGIRNWRACPLVTNTVRKRAESLVKERCETEWTWNFSPCISATNSIGFASLLSVQLSDSDWWVCQANVWYPLSSERDSKFCC